MSNQQRMAALAIARADGSGHAPLRWLWPIDGNRWDTRQLVTRRHPNAVKCNYTPLPGRSNKRQLRRARARNSNGNRRTQVD